MPAKVQGAATQSMPGFQAAAPAPSMGSQVGDVLRGATEAGATIYEARAISDIMRGDRILKIKWFFIGLAMGWGLRRQITRLFKG